LSRYDTTLTKLTPPRLEGVYERRRLYNELDRLKRSPITWVAAPAGSGKTTLVASYLAARKLPCVWYRIDSGDDDPASFFHHLALAVKKRQPRTRRPLPSLRPEHAGDLVAFARNFFREVGRRLQAPYVLVFDDLQEVSEKRPLNELLCAGLTELAACIRVVLVSRAEPPRAFARLRANRSLACLDGCKLKLHEQESRAVARSLGVHKSRLPHVSQLHRQVEGWMAGLILLLDTADTAAPNKQTLSVGDAQPLFDYFAAELFAHRRRSVREFLMQTALLPAFTLEMAQQLTSEPDARAILDSLVRQHHFTERHGETRTSYRYHPLFRAFLLDQTRSTWDGLELTQRQRAAASVLEAEGQTEPALELYLVSGDAQAARRLLIASARDFLATGRSDTLAASIERLPQSIAESEPWLQYWLGACRLTRDPAAARARFEAAYRRFRETADAAGCYLAWAGVVDCCVLLWSDFAELEVWLAEFDELERRLGRAAPAAAVEQAVCAMLSAQVLFRPTWETIRKWLVRAEKIARTSRDSDLRMRIIGWLGLYYSWMGKMSRYDVVIESARRLARGTTASALARLQVLLMEAQRFLLRGDPSSVLATMSQAESLASESGVRAMDDVFRAYVVYAHAHLGDLQAAEAARNEFSSSIAPGSHLFLAYGSYLGGCLATIRGDFPAAVEHFTAALGIAQANGALMAIAMAQLGLARALAETQRLEPARVAVDSALALAQEMRSHLFEFECRLVLAAIAERSGHRAALLDNLRRAFTLIAQHGFRSYAVWDARFMSRLCGIALENGVHIATVREVIAARGLLPDSEVGPLESWPWPVKVRALGGFELLVNDEPVHVSGKAQKKPLELLQVLIALGGRNIREDQLAETLWPHSDGDAAARAFDTTLHRLRRLLRCDRAIAVSGGRVSLDSRYVWVDASALEHALAGPSDFVGKPHALSLYRGPFLGRDAPAWALPMRERLRSMLLRAIESAGRLHEERGQIENAIECYRRGIETDPLAETLYRRLMLCYERSDRRAEALATYSRLAALLASQLGMQPSVESRRLYRRLRDEADRSET